VAVDDKVIDERVMCGYPVPEQWLVQSRNIYDAPFTHWFMQHVRHVAPTATVGTTRAACAQLPVADGDLGDLEVRRADGGAWPLAEMLRATFTDGFIVLHRGTVRSEHYLNGMRPETSHMWQSVSKSLGGCVAANLVERGELDPEALIIDYVPELAESAYGDARVRHLLDMTVGVRYSEDYTDPDSEISRLDRLYGFRAPTAADEPGSSYRFAQTMVKEGEHGEVFHYVSLDLQVLAWVMERVTDLPLPLLIEREVWAKLGAEHDAYIALDGAGSAQLEGGFCSSLRDLARFGVMLCQDGRFNGSQVVPSSWIADTLTNGDKEAFKRAEGHEELAGGSYRNNFWVAALEDHSVFMGLGIYGQMLYVNPAAELVVAKFSTQPTALDPAILAHNFYAAESLAAALAGGA
jgi:CubicO group peptidase (beta-lactamase class C family)